MFFVKCSAVCNGISLQRISWLWYIFTAGYFYNVYLHGGIPSRHISLLWYIVSNIYFQGGIYLQRRDKCCASVANVIVRLRLSYRYDGQDKQESQPGKTGGDGMRDFTAWRVIYSLQKRRSRHWRMRGGVCVAVCVAIIHGAPDGTHYAYSAWVNKMQRRGLYKIYGGKGAVYTSHMGVLRDFA